MTYVIFGPMVIVQGSKKSLHFVILFLTFFQVW